VIKAAQRHRAVAHQPDLPEDHIGEPAAGQQVNIGIFLSAPCSAFHWLVARGRDDRFTFPAIQG